VNLILLGPPGAGKGTQASRLSAALNIPHISTGDILRRSVRERTELGLVAKTYMDAGKLVPDHVVLRVTEERLRQPDAARGFILDGFPRNIRQARALADLLKDLGKSIDLVLDLTVPEAELVRRMTGRRVCPTCGSTYHLVFNPPSSLGECDRCGSDLYQREDDKESTVRHRLRVYREETDPLIDYYRERGSLVQVDGSMPVDEVYRAIAAAIPGLGEVEKGLDHT